MAQDMSILAAAQRKFDQDKERRAARFDRRVQEIYLRQPRLQEIDRQLRGTAGRIVMAALETDGDPGPALRELERENLELQRERSELLVASGYSYDELDEKPACPFCQDRGYLSDGSMCRCLKGYYTREQNSRLSKLLDLGNQSFDTFSLDWYSDQVWPEYGCSPLRNMETVLEICGNYAHKFGPRSGNLLFTGAPGLGKTFLSSCIARAVSENGFSVVYDTAVSVFASFEEQKFSRDAEDGRVARDETRRYLNCDLLILDDLGSELTTPFVQSALYTLINTRLQAGRRTVISTNLTMEELRRRYSVQVGSRLDGEYHVLRFFGEDIRLLRKQRL